MRLAVIAAVFLFALFGWAAGGLIGGAIGLALATALVVYPWRGQPLWSWAQLYLRRNQSVSLAEPVTVANDRAGAGVRYQDGVAVVAVQVLGKRHAATMFTGSASTHTDNTLDIAELHSVMKQSLGLTIDSMSVVTFGARRRATGDFAPVYDTMIGPPPYAGQRETWLIARLSSYRNADALHWRPTAGTAAVAAAQRISAALRVRGIRARVATSTDMVELERRLGSSALEPGRRTWRSLRSDSGWLTTYWYRNANLTAEVLAQAWSMRVDTVTQTVTLFPDHTMQATITVRTAQPPTAPPAVILRTLSGEQANALASSLCLPLPRLRGIRRGPTPANLAVPIGASGVLLGKVGAGDRMMLPLIDPGEFSRVHIAAEDSLIKRLMVRMSAAGDRITFHTTDIHRWASIRMPDIAVTDRRRPVAGTAISVLDGSLSPSPRPNTVISVGGRDQPRRGNPDVTITQIGPALLEVVTADQVYTVEVELFRAENRYVSSESMSMMSGTRSHPRDDFTDR